jgi:hypothetical protein
MSRVDTLILVDPVTGEEITRILPPRPISFNSDTIVSSETDLAKRPGYDSVKVSSFIFNMLKSDLQKLDDGSYIIAINNPVISKEGMLVYYEFKGLQKVTTTKAPAGKKHTGRGTYYEAVKTTVSDKDIPATLKITINNEVQKLLDHMPFFNPAYQSTNEPGAATPDVYAVACTGTLFTRSELIIIKDHQATFTPSLFSL